MAGGRNADRRRQPHGSTVMATGNWQWLTTAPNPRSRSTGYDAGQRGWRLHAVDASDTEPFAAIKGRVAACGLNPYHGWGLDMFIDEKCKRCIRKVGA